ncbi:hypothetical protein GQ457_01G046050 [Hibiscus cannabinus]
MLKGKALIKETNMLEKMQTQAMDSASQALDLYDVSDCISIAAHIKKEKKNKTKFAALSKLRPTLQCHMGPCLLSNSFFICSVTSFSILLFSNA